MKRRDFLRLLPVLASIPLVSRLIPTEPEQPVARNPMGHYAYNNMPDSSRIVEQSYSFTTKVDDMWASGWDGGWQLSTEDLAAIAQEMTDGTPL